ncbi:hypothetical protein BDQ12DRAFT_606691, partial [Crucibulum laeve]
EALQVASDWQLYKAGKEIKCGYLSSGFTKYAFQGKLNSIEIAIFQHKQVNSSSEMNEQDLHAEMEVAVLAQYLLDSFYCHGEGLVIKWNLPFFGTLLDHSAVADINTLHSRSLLWKDFLVAPLLIIGGEYKEIKFSGTEDFSPNTNVIGQTINTYVHHTLIDSGGTLLLADVQGDSTYLFI